MEAFGRQLDLVARLEGLAWKGRLELVPLGVEDRCFQPPERSQARGLLGIPSSARVALWIGRLSASSKADLHPLLHQWRALAAEDGNRLLVLAGGGTEGDVKSLSETASDLGISRSIRILPDIDDGTKLDLLGASDVFVSPVDNHQETFGISVVEAMAAGLPVVASDWDGYKDLVEHGTTGLRVPVDWVSPPPDTLLLREILEPRLAQLVSSQGVAVDPGALREALGNLLADPIRSKGMGLAGKARARRLFAWPVVISRCTEVWASLSRLAVEQPVPKSREMDPDIIDPAEIFSHYGTRPPNNLAERVRLTSLGCEILEGRAPMPPTFTDVLAISDGKLLTALVLELRGGPRVAADHLAECISGMGRDPAEARWLLSWLIKYGVVATTTEKT